MKNLKELLVEKLKINSQSKVNNSDYDNFCYPTHNSNGKEKLWFRWWKYLIDNGPMSKSDLLNQFGLTPTSYGTEFAKLSKRNIIVPIKGKLEAKEPDEWIPNIK